ncbi:DUF1343 domain-containing protein [candidate division KSB1 bacterium]|nr:DUF1343 domain-containing protein [candidate division KSB1 bacterium]
MAKNQDSLSKFLSMNDPVLYDGRLGLLCNQTSFSYDRRHYLFNILAKRGNLERLFLPEHGLFAELQDQVPLVSTQLYDYLHLGIEIISLYGDRESSLVVDPAYLNGLDALIVDIQDIGSRYYTFATTVSYIFDVLASQHIDIEVYVLDRPNPCGRQVEGTRLNQKYASFVGRPGLPHKHGLTIGELCQFYIQQTDSKFKLHIVPFDWNARIPTWEIAPSPNMPTSVTPLVYTGQCLLEGTNISEGRGTTRPFEIWGAPFMQWIHGDDHFPQSPAAILRPIRFVPMFHKHSGVVCDGFQLHLTDRPYHSLEHSLRMINYIRSKSGSDFHWRDEAYEFREDKPAIEILAGDDMLIHYLSGDIGFDEVVKKIVDEEESWINEAAAYLLYPQKLTRVDFRKH